MHAVEGRTGSPLSAHPPRNPPSSSGRVPAPGPGPWERMAQRWPHTVPTSHSMSSVSERDGTVPSRRLAGPRELPSSAAAARAYDGVPIDGFHRMHIGSHGPGHPVSRYRTVSGSAAQANKPLPPLPPARTPSQFHHQRMNHVGTTASQARGLPSFPSTLQRSNFQDTRLPSAPPTVPTPITHRHASQPVDSLGERGTAGASTMQTPARPHRMYERPLLPSQRPNRGAEPSPASIQAEPIPRPRPHPASPTKAAQRSTPAQQQFRGEVLPAMPMPTAIARPPPRTNVDSRTNAARTNLPPHCNPPAAVAAAAASHPSTSSSTRHASASASAPASADLSPPPPSYDMLFGPRVTFEEEELSIGRAQTEPAVESNSRPTSTSTCTPTRLSPLKPGQCWGIKRDGGRCTRIVAESSTRSSRARASQTPSPTKPRKNGKRASAAAGEDRRRRRHVSEPPSNYQCGEYGNASRPIVVSDDSSSGSDDSDGDSDSSDDLNHGANRRQRSSSHLPIYCHQHAKEINKSPGFHLSEPPHTYIQFETYIPSDLSPTTAARLRIAMTEPMTSADMKTPGYIYIYELLPLSAAATAAPRLRLKIGRSHHPMNRIAQWRSQCVNRTPVLRCLYPQVAASSSGSASARPPDTPRQGLIVGADSVLTQGVRGSHKWEKLVHIELAERCARLVESCGDCGKRHREIFETTGAPVDDEFRLVCDVVAKWEKFVRVCVEH